MTICRKHIKYIQYYRIDVLTITKTQLHWKCTSHFWLPKKIKLKTEKAITTMLRSEWAVWPLLLLFVMHLWAFWGCVRRTLSSFIVTCVLLLLAQDVHTVTENWIRLGHLNLYNRLWMLDHGSFVCLLKFEYVHFGECGIMCLRLTYCSVTTKLGYWCFNAYSEFCCLNQWRYFKQIRLH